MNTELERYMKVRPKGTPKMLLTIWHPCSRAGHPHSRMSIPWTCSSVKKEKLSAMQQNRDDNTMAVVALSLIGYWEISLALVYHLVKPLPEIITVDGTPVD